MSNQDDQSLEIIQEIVEISEDATEEALEPPLWDAEDWFANTPKKQCQLITASLGIDDLSTVFEIRDAAQELTTRELNEFRSNEFGGFEIRSVERFLRNNALPVRCSCGCKIVSRFVPELTAHSKWEDLLDAHGSDCDWVQSRGQFAPRSDVDSQRLSELIQVMIETENYSDWNEAAEVLNDWLTEQTGKIVK